MKFARIEMLFLIWALPPLFLVFLYGMKKRRKILSGFAHERGLDAIVPYGCATRRRIKACLLLFTLVFLAFALSGPQYGYRWKEIEQKGIDIIIALDCSRSMLAADIKPSRLDRAKREVVDLISLLQGDRVGLVAFAGTAFLQCPLTLDYNAFHLFLNALSPDFLPVGGTDISGAVYAAMTGFDEKDNSEKAIILITDGEHTGEVDPIKAAKKAKQAGIKIFCIGVGGDEGAPVPDKNGGFKKDGSGKIVLTKLGEDTLKKMAILTGGAYVRSVAGDMDLDVIYKQEIRKKMESATISSGRKQIWEDRYQWFLALAIIALIVELFLPSIRKTALIPILLFFVLSAPLAYAGHIKDGIKAYENGEYEAALKFFIDAQLDDPENPEILYNIGNAYYKMGDFDSAYKNYAQALKSEEKPLKQKATYNLGNSSFRKGALEEAVKHYESALAISPNDEQAKQNLEYVKKLIEKQKTEQQQQKKTDNPQSEKNNEKQEQDAAEKKGQDNQKEQSSPDYGKEMKNDKREGAKPEQAKGDQKKDESQNTVDKKKVEAGEKRPSGSTEEKNQAQRTLNRLKDQPGKALMPHYQKKNIEKDW